MTQPIHTPDQPKSEIWKPVRINGQIICWRDVRGDRVKFVKRVNGEYIETVISVVVFFSAISASSITTS